MPDNYTDFGESALVRPGDPPYDPPMQIPEGVDWRIVSQVTGMMDRQRENQEKARQQAIRYRGQQEFRRLVASGMKPEMALREVAVDLFEDDPSAMASTLIRTSPDEAKVAQPIYRTGRGGVIGEMRGGRFETVPGQPPPIVRPPPIQRTLNQIDAAALKQELADVEANKAFDARGTMPFSSRGAMPDQRGVERAKVYQKYRDKLAPQNPAMPVSASKADKVQVRKDGKKFWLPKSQLDEALKQDYELVP